MNRLGVRRALAFGSAVALLASACSAPILANGPIVFPSPPVANAAPSRPPDPIPISFPRDDGAHDRLMEWWYYTGHLRYTEPELGNQRNFGFEAVVFRAERGAVPPVWAAHLALTEEPPGHLRDGTFHYAQRNEIGAQVDHSPRDASGAPTGFDLQIGGLSSTLVAAGAPAFAAPWRLAGGDGKDHIEAALAPEEAAAAGRRFGLRLDLDSTKPPALHDGGGFVDFGPAGSSYYYSRTRLAVTGTLDLEREQLPVEGIAWFDHQWGDFVSVGAGGWDWFAINLDDGTDLTISLVRDASGQVVVQYGTVVDPDGTARGLAASEFSASAISTWPSPHSGHTYVTRWLLAFPAVLPIGPVTIDLEPTVYDQELDTRATTGVAYWEGSQVVTVTEVDTGNVGSVGGQAYVEMTRYGP
jgi:predicted secreted hydrolase